ncbi:hypothetical protein PVAND_002799 [Polypedilum vanderplanki]|uniref:Uncharacterized protein n=1 Tax=Polypedilum vanderplanki TaxID=319348 RepID=A0A9J6BSG7_POLVA|nr:hypothetical protein PVAND_002799 [Polypedilum vanderplanki]
MNSSSALLRHYVSLTFYCWLLSVRACHGNVLQAASVEMRGSLGTFAAEKIIEKIQARMRYGFPLLKIEPLSPLKLNNRDCSINFSFLHLNSSFNQLLLEGIDRFTINHVQFNWRNKSMDFSLTFHELNLKGDFDGIGNFIKYIPFAGSGNFTYTIYNMTTNVFAAIGIKSSRMQIQNFTTILSVEKIKSNIKGISSDNFISTRIINRLLNRLIELTSYQIFKLNQRLINHILDIYVVPPINHILTMFIVLAPSTKFENSNEASQTVYLHELDDKSIVEYLIKHPTLLLKQDDRIKSIFRRENDHYSSKRILCE